MQDNAVSRQNTVPHRTCPQCLAINSLEQLKANQYRCSKCKFELAYIYDATGGRHNSNNLLGWVREIGEKIKSRYEIIEVLGKGGFGSTYLVKDLEMYGQLRALKEVPQEMFDKDEAKILGRLNHPGIPNIIDEFDSDDKSIKYMVLEFGGRRTLKNECERLGGRIPLATLVPWMRELCDVLDYLHSHQPPIVHRDLKPANILLDDRDHVMLIDFGIAKLDDYSKTRTLAGRAYTQFFSSPEQLARTGTDQRSDIYSLGATIYFLLTGKYPSVSAKGTVDALAKIVPDVPPELNRAVIQALELDPDKRQQSVKEFINLFDSLIQTKPKESNSRQKLLNKIKSRTAISVGLSMLVFLTGSGVAWYFFPGHADRPFAGQSKSLIKVNNLMVVPETVTAGGTVEVALSYVLMFSEGVEHVTVEELWSVKKDNLTVLNMPPSSRPEQKAGIYVSKITLTIPKEMPPGSYTILCKVRSSDSSDMYEKSFKIMPPQQ